jgi:L-lactate utilization protein LutC
MIPAPTASALRRFLLVGLPVLLLLGCVSVKTRKPNGEEVVMSKDQFAQYVEHVFRYHNQVMTELMESSEERLQQSPATASALKNAERSMISACEPLNEVVSETLSGENVGLKLKMQLSDAVPACEAASQAVEKLIP